MAAIKTDREFRAAAADAPGVGPGAARVRHDWSRAGILALFALPFPELVFRAQAVHREHFAPDEVQLSTLLNIKEGGCPEDCGYCSQSVHHDTGVAASALMDAAAVAAEARKAKAGGAQRFCMGAAWRALKDRDLPKIAAILAEVKALGLETCMTLGMLTEAQATALKAAGLDYYNHNLDTSPEFYDRVITTRTYHDRLDTLAAVRAAGIKVCCGGIVGMGETRRDRAGLLQSLANLPEHPESVPINLLVPVDGTPLAGRDRLDTIEFVRTIAVARIVMPASYVRLSAGRRALTDAEQALCFLAGANSIFYGDKLLTTPNPEADDDRRLLAALGMTAAT
jgi:biotin synthase